MPPHRSSLPRRRPGRRSFLLGGATLACLGAPGCATTQAGPHPAEIPALEARIDAGGSDAGILTRLGVAYRSEGRREAAADAFESALEEDSDYAPAAYFLALTHEEAGEFREAQALYERFLETTSDEDVADMVRDRLPGVRRRALELEVREAVANEESFTETPSPSTVAVLPFRYAGAREDLRPLGRALAELLVTDLSQTDRLTVLERSRIQLLLDEMELAEQGLVEPATAARSGRMLGAGSVVQGTIGGAEDMIDLEAVVAPVGQPEAAVPEPIRERDALDRLFDMEERMALSIFQDLGIELTAAERERVADRPTANVQALLAYGLGLEAEDRGDYEAAAQHFQRASELDPGFGMAASAVGRTRLEAQWGGTAVSSLIDLGAQNLLAVETFSDLLTLQYAFLPMEVLLPTFGPRDISAEVLGVEGIVLLVRPGIELILRLP